MYFTFVYATYHQHYHVEGQVPWILWYFEETNRTVSRNGEIIICCSFNARIGNLNNNNLRNTEPIPQRECLDAAINSHGRQLVDFLIDCDLVILNGRCLPQMNKFTASFTFGKSVVDYGIVLSNCFVNYNHLKVQHAWYTWWVITMTLDDQLLSTRLLGVYNRWYFERRTSKIIAKQQHKPTQWKAEVFLWSLRIKKKWTRPANKELQDLILNDTMHTLNTRLKGNYNSFHPYMENTCNNKKTHHRSSKIDMVE